MKSLEEFVKLFAEQLDETAENALKANTVFKELDDWSSLVALSIIAMVDEEYGVALKGDDIRNADTIEDLYNIVNTRM